MATAMLARRAVNRSAWVSAMTRRAYATESKVAGPTSAVAETYDPEQDPQLAGMAYPKLPTTSRQHRSPYGWWDKQERIAFGEPVPENDDIQSMWAPDAHTTNPRAAFLQLLAMFGAVGLFSLGVWTTFSGRPNLPRAYPYDGLVKELSGTEDAEYAARPTSANEVEDE